VADWTQADVDALKAAMKSGTLTVGYSNRSVTYRDLDEMLALLSLMEKSAQGTSAITYRLAVVRKGA
jgi:hypothetical protein